MTIFLAVLPSFHYREVGREERKGMMEGASEPDRHRQFYCFSVVHILLCHGIL